MENLENGEKKRDERESWLYKTEDEGKVEHHLHTMITDERSN